MVDDGSTHGGHCCSTCDHLPPTPSRPHGAEVPSNIPGSIAREPQVAGNHSGIRRNPNGRIACWWSLNAGALPMMIPDPSVQ